MRTALLALEVVFALALLALGAAQHWLSDGVKTGLMVLTVALAAAHARRLAALAGRVRPPPVAVLLLEAVTLVGAFTQYTKLRIEVVALALAVGVAHAWSTDDAPAIRPSRLLRAASVLAALVAGASVLADVAHDPEVPLLRLALYAVILVEALHPRGPRSDADSIRRLAAASTLVATSAPVVQI